MSSIFIVAFTMVLTVTVLVLGAPQSSFGGAEKTSLKRLGQCRGKSTLPVLFHGVKVGRSPRAKEKSLSFNLTIKKEIGDDLYIIVDFSRCDPSGSPDSCEFVLKDFKVTGVCEIMGQKDELWSDFLDHLNTPKRCPIRAGEYKMNNCPINADFLKFLPMRNALYKAKLTGFSHGKLIACVEVEELVLIGYDKTKPY